MTDSESWRPVAGYEGLYEVSTLGRVRSCERLVLKPAKILKSIKGPRYLQVTLYKHGKQRAAHIHRLVCEAFHGTAREGMEVAHNDGDGFNPRADNLRWATHTENKKDELMHGTRPMRTRHHAAKLTESDVEYIKNNNRSSLRSLAERFGVSISNVHQIRHGKTWKEGTK